MGAEEDLHFGYSSYDTLVKNVAAFCPCAKNLFEAKVKRFILTTLTKEVSKIPAQTLSTGLLS